MPAKLEDDTLTGGPILSLFYVGDGHSGTSSQRKTGGREYLLASTDYFTKWIEAVSLAKTKIIEQEVQKFMSYADLGSRTRSSLKTVSNSKEGLGILKGAWYFVLQQASTPRYHNITTGERASRGIKRSSKT